MRPPDFVIGGSDDPYLLRWYVIPRNRFFNIYLHKFLRSDDDRALHDHPWVFLSIILKGGYWEHRKGSMRWRSAGSVAIRRPTTAHRVELDAGLEEITTDSALSQSFTGPDRRRTKVDVDVEDGKPIIRYWRTVERPCWTIFLTGPKIRAWGFHCPKGWVHWARFTHGSPNGAEATRGCGEQ